MQSEANGIIRIGSYKLDKKQVLGKGATGYVYKGHHAHTKQSVAIKAIDMSQVNNEVTEYLLEGEKKAMTSIKNPHVVKCYEVVQERDCCYMAMEECLGGTLKDYIARKGKLDGEEAVELFRKIVIGYSSIIEKLFIHRDLKTANILLRDPADPVIIDFGYCEMIMGKRPLIQYNVGSPAYMAPEAYTKHRYSEKSDIWALGIVLYEMLTGRTPDQGIDIKEYFKLIERQGRVRFEFEGINPVCQELLSMSLKVNVDERATIHKLKYIIDKSLIPQMQAKLNKTQSDGPPLPPSSKNPKVQPLKFMRPAEFNFHSAKEVGVHSATLMKRHKESKEKQESSESPMARRTSYVPNHNTVSYIQFGPPQTPQRQNRNFNKNQFVQQRHQPQNVPPMPPNPPPHEPHMILRKSMEKMAQPIKHRKAVTQLVVGEPNFRKGPPLQRAESLQYQFVARDPTSMRMI